MILQQLDSGYLKPTVSNKHKNAKEIDLRTLNEKGKNDMLLYV